MPRGLLIVLAAVLVVGVAVFEGLRSNRWGDSEDVKLAAARLERVPRQVGAWHSSADKTIDPKVVEKAEAAGYVSREYVNRNTGVRLEVLLLCGPSGPIGAHTPEVCYGGLGYECVGKPRPRTLTVANGPTPATLWNAGFQKKDPHDNPLRVYWAWGVDGDWKASEEPRIDFAQQRALFKLYVVHHETAAGLDPAKEFFDEFLPALKVALSPDPNAPVPPR